MRRRSGKECIRFVYTKKGAPPRCVCFKNLRTGKLSPGPGYKVIDMPWGSGVREICVPKGR
jgi:hypothetical protein